MPLPTYQSVPLPSFGAMQPHAPGQQSVESERVLNLLHDVDERVAELYPQLSDHWLQSELYAFLHVKDELVSRIKKRATRKHSVAAGVAERRKELRVSTSAAAAATTTGAAVGAAAGPLASPDSGATEIAKGNVPQTPANEAMAATPARQNKSLNKPKSSVSNKQRVSAALKEMAGEEEEDTASTETAPAVAAVIADKDEEAKEAEVISPLPSVGRVGGTTGAKGRAVSSSSTNKQRSDVKRLGANHSSSNGSQSSIPVFTASAAAINRKKAAVPAFARKGTKLTIESPAPGQTARVLQEEHAELAVKLDELQTRHKQLADKQEKYIKKREREEEERRKKEQEAATAALNAMTEEQSVAVSAPTETEADSSEMLRAPPSPGRLMPLSQEGPTSPRSPRHTPTSSMSNALSPLTSARPLRPNSPSLPPLSVASTNLSPLTARVAAAPLSSRDQIVQPTAYANGEAQRGTVCSGLLLCAATPRLLLRPSTQEMEDRQGVQQTKLTAPNVEQSTAAEVEPLADEQPLEQQPTVTDAEYRPEQAATEAVADVDPLQDSSTQLVSTTIRPSSRFADKLTVDVLSSTDSTPTAASKPPPGSSLSPTSSASTSRTSSPLGGTAAPRTLRPSTAEISNSAAVATSPPTPSARSRMVHRPGQPIGLGVVPTSPASSARSRAASSETYEESFPTIGSRRSSIQREEAAVVAETVKGLGNLVENHRIEAAVEAAEERIKKERWMAVMKDIEKRKRGGETSEADEESARQRRKWRDESLITANDLRKQIALMGIRIDEADEKGVSAMAGSKRTSIPPAVDPLQVPLPLSARTARSTPRPPTSTSAAVEAAPEPQSETTDDPQLAVAQPTDYMSSLPAVDPSLVPLPPSSRTAAQTARTQRSARPSDKSAPPSARTAVQTARKEQTPRASDEPAESTVSESQEQQQSDSANANNSTVTESTETAQVDEQQSQSDEAVAPEEAQDGSDASSYAVQKTEERVETDVAPQAEGYDETTQLVTGTEGEMTEGSSE